jgi:hypothetical protein
MITITKVKRASDLRCNNCGVPSENVYRFWKVMVGDRKLLLCDDCLTQLSRFSAKAVKLV